MKKIFWTSIVWIVLVCGFILYLKWFNQPLADNLFTFVDPDFECPTLQCDTAACPECITSCEECSEELECPEVEEVECNCPSQSIEKVSTSDNDGNWTDLFSQLDRIESMVKNVSNGEVSETVSDEQLFEEFKARREANQ